MRVLQLTQRFPPAIGGVENHVLNLASKLTATGANVEVLTTDLVRDVPFLRLEGEGPRFPFQVRRSRALKLAQLPHGLGIAAPSMLPSALSYPTDIIHAHAYGYFTTYVGAIVRRLRKYPLVITPHSDPGRASTAKSIFDILVPRLTLLRAQRIIALTKSEAKYLKSLGVSTRKIDIVPNGVNLEEFHGKTPKPKRDYARVLFVGRLYPDQKGVEVLIRAISYLPASLKLQLLVAGEDWGGVSVVTDLARKLGVEERVVLLGRISRENLLQMYASADLFVLPSFFESFPIVLLEAMAAELPVVASDVGGIPEVVEDGRTGLLVKPGDPGSLAASIEELLSNDSERRSMGEAARERASLFSWNLVVPRIRQVYEEAISENVS